MPLISFLRIAFAVMLFTLSLTTVRADTNLLSTTSDNGFAVLIGHYAQVAHDSASTTYNLSVDNNQGAWYYVSVSPRGNGPSQSSLPKFFMLAPWETNHFIGQVKFYNQDGVKLFADGTTNHIEVAGMIAADVLYRTFTAAPLPYSANDGMTQIVTGQTADPDFAGLSLDISGGFSNTFAIINDISAIGANNEVLRTFFTAKFGLQLPSTTFFLYARVASSAASVLLLSTETLNAVLTNSSWDGLAFDATITTSGGGGGGGGGGATGYDNAVYVADLTVPDGTTFSPTQGFSKVWQMSNTGSNSWGNGYKWTFDGGDKMGGPDTISVPTINPGFSWNPAVNLTAPTAPGTYRGYWRMQSPNGQKFGTRVWVQIQVSSGGSDNANFMADVTVPDNTSFTTNQGFTKVWRILNTGSNSWGSGYAWTFSGGDQMGGPNSITVPGVSPGGTWNPTLNLTAPSSPGTYKGYWRMQAPDGHQFGDRVWVQIQVSQGSTNVSTFVSESDTASGADQPGFWKQGTPQYWHDATDAGDGGHMYWTYNNDNAHGTDDVGFWRPNLPNTQPYEVYVFVPRNHATTTQARYSIYAADGQHDVTVNQNQYYDQWVSLGTYQFNSGTSGYLRLIDQTGEGYASRWVGFDSAQWQARTSVPPPTPTTAVVSESDTAPYDGAPGFFRHGTAAYWHNAAYGDGGHMYWTYNNDPAHGSDDVGDWRPSLGTPGNYRVSVYIPNNYANTTQAHYTVYAADGQHDVYVNQSAYFNTWITLGTYRFGSGTGALLRLVDQTSEKYISKWVGFDTAKWEPVAGNAYAPSNLQPSGDAVVNDNVTFSWQDNGMDDGNPSHDFQIQVWHVVNGGRSDQVWSSDWRSGTSQSWSAPGPGEYEWFVQAGNGNGQSAASSPARFVVPVPVPDAPSSLVANALTPISVDLVWQDNSTVENGFSIERQTGNSGFVQIGTVGANVTHFTDMAVLPNSTFVYRVQATGDGGGSGYTNEATATTPANYAVVSLSLTPNTMPGGTGATGTVLLSGPALPSGSVVTLTSSNSIVTVPAQVTVPAGQVTAMFTLQASPVTASTPLSITASNAVSSTSAAVTVVVPLPASVTFTAQPPKAVALGNAFKMTASVKDAVGNPVIDGTAVTLALVTPAGATLSGNTATTSGGVATFPAVTINQSGAYTLTGTSGDVTSPASTPVTVNSVISTLGPSSATAGGGAFTLTVGGAGFVSGSVVKWNGAGQKTTFVSGTTLTASIPASLISAAGTAQVTVTTPHVGNSNSFLFTVNPKLAIVSLSPSSKKRGSGSFIMTVTGTAFVSGSVVKWNGVTQPTQYVSSTLLTVTIPTSLLKVVGTAQVTVTTPHIGTSNASPFTITP